MRPDFAEHDPYPSEGAIARADLESLVIWDYNLKPPQTPSQVKRANMIRRKLSEERHKNPNRYASLTRGRR